MNVLDDCCIAIALFHAIKKKKRVKRAKRLWMKECFKKRHEFTPENLLNELQLSSPSDFRNFLHMEEDTYQELLSLVGPKIKKQDTIMRDAISPNQRLSITLRFLATGNSFSDLECTNAISIRSISGIVMETCAEINRTLANYIKISSNEIDWKKIATDFYNRWNFANCVGGIDGKHIAIKKPLNSGYLYYNYKEFFSIVLMAVVNASYEFITVDVSINGRVSNDDVLNDTSFGRALYGGSLNLPKLCTLPSSNKELPFVFVGSNAFPLSDHLMTPYSQVDLTEQQRIFNYHLSRVQRMVDNAFGILVSRFRVLQGAIGLSPDKAQVIVLTCCYLHNFLCRKKPNSYISVDAVDNENLVDGSITEGLWRNDCEPTPLLNIQCQNPANSAKLIREQICNYFNNEGQVHRQKKTFSTTSNNL